MAVHAHRFQAYNVTDCPLMLPESHPVMRYATVFCLALVALMTACSLDRPASAETVFNQNNAQSPQTNLEIAPTSTPQPVAGAVGPWEYPAGVNPLTGQPVDDPAQLLRLPIIAKISNAPPLVRPQAGIGAADIVFEHYAEGGLTRFSAVFYGQAPTRVGSLRSARLIDHEIVPMFDGILMFTGASIGVEKYIYGSEDVERRIPGADQVAPARHIPPSEYADRAYKGILYGPPYYWRDEDIPMPHNLFGSTAAIWELAASQGHDRAPHLRGLAFHEQPPHPADGPAQEIDLRYRGTRVRWEYDAELGLYRRFADGQVHADATTGQQITAANVVVISAEHTDTYIVESVWQDNITPSTQIAVWGQNDAILFRDGQRYDGYWTRTVREDIISLRTPDGELLYLKPGNTWFQVIRSADQQNPAEEWLIVE